MTRIKLCGLFRPEDVDAVNAARPDFCGFVVNYPRSHRNVSPDQLRTLRAKLDDGILPVGVFVDQPPETVAALLNEGTIDAAQLHGHEDDAYIARLRELSTRGSIWKAFPVHTPADLDRARASTADLILLDNGYGTGKMFDWSLIREVGRLWILAGGLTPENLWEAVRTLRPFAVDLSSGVETERRKDPAKLLAAVEALYGAGRTDGVSPLTTPLGELIVSIDGAPVPYTAYPVPVDRTCPDLDGRYFLSVPLAPDSRQHTISCRLKDYRPSDRDGVESGEHLECKSFYRDAVKVSIGMEGETRYVYGQRDSPYDYDTAYQFDGVKFETLSITRTRRFVFGIAWLNRCTVENDVQTWYGADPTLF